MLDGCHAPAGGASPRRQMYSARTCVRDARLWISRAVSRLPRSLVAPSMRSGWRPPEVREAARPIRTSGGGAKRAIGLVSNGELGGT